MAKENSLDSWIDPERLEELVDLLRPGSLDRPGAPVDADAKANPESGQGAPGGATSGPSTKPDSDLAVEHLLPDEIPQRVFAKGVRQKLPPPETKRPEKPAEDSEAPELDSVPPEAATSSVVASPTDRREPEHEEEQRTPDPNASADPNPEAATPEPSPSPQSPDQTHPSVPPTTPPTTTPPKRESNPLTLYFHSVAPTPEARAQAFVSWVRRTADASAAFVVDGYGAAIASEPQTDTVFLASLSNLADALGRGRDHFSRPEQNALHLELEDGQILCVLQAKWDVATVALGLIRSTPLPREIAVRYRMELAKLAQKPRSRPRD